ncbi:unnamed protein product [Adineta steineri]|uniref:Uncharacterized protein n=1 Tax=Adineta steineri TaxID=433720 RepID=A0A819CQD8_9BILA|nr:unnamed protein product [Adineta steineri]CAF3811630.1 unnamed protein product [Adineta steineri]
MENNMNELQQQRQMLENTTKLLSLLASSSLSSTPITPVRTRNVVNAIYIAGIVFMIIVFLVLLWINLCSRQCWCWHDTSLSNRFNRRLLIKHSIVRNASSSTENQQHKKSTIDF